MSIRPMPAPVLAVFLAVLAAVAVMAGGARAEGLAAPGPAAPEAADQTLGMAIMAADVAYFSGTLLRSSGAVSSQRLSVGRYRLTFVRDIEDCYVTATVYDAGFGHGFAVSWLRQDNHVDIVTKNGLDGSNQDHSFQAIVFCPK